MSQRHVTVGVADQEGARELDHGKLIHGLPNQTRARLAALAAGTEVVGAVVDAVDPPAVPLDHHAHASMDGGELGFAHQPSTDASLVGHDDDEVEGTTQHDERLARAWQELELRPLSDVVPDHLTVDDPVPVEEQGPGTGGVGVHDVGTVGADPKTLASTSSEIACPMVMWASWMCAVTADGTAIRYEQCSASAPPSRPVMPTTSRPSCWAWAAALTTL